MNKKLAHIASYLEVTAEGWLDWTETKRVHYISKFDKLSVKDLAKGKNIPEGKEQHEDQESLEYEELPKDDITSLYDTSSLAELIKTIIKGAEQLLNSSNSVQRKPTVSSDTTRIRYPTNATRCLHTLHDNSRTKQPLPRKKLANSPTQF